MPPDSPSSGTNKSPPGTSAAGENRALGQITEDANSSAPCTSASTFQVSKSQCPLSSRKEMSSSDDASRTPENDCKTIEESTDLSNVPIARIVETEDSVANTRHASNTVTEYRARCMKVPDSGKRKSSSQRADVDASEALQIPNQAAESVRSSENGDGQAQANNILGDIDFGDGDEVDEEEDEDDDDDDDEDDDEDDMEDTNGGVVMHSGFAGISSLNDVGGIAAALAATASSSNPNSCANATLPPSRSSHSEAEGTMSVRKSLLDAIVEHQARRISELERRLDKKRAKIELLSSTPTYHPGIPGLGLLPPHPAAAVGHSAVAAAAAAHVQQQAQAAVHHHPYFMTGATGAHLLGMNQANNAVNSAGPDADHKQSRYWTADEHQRFLQAVKQCGPKNYVQIAEIVGTRNAKQVRTHAQKFQKKLEREDAKARRNGGSVAHAASVAAAAAAAAGGGAPPPSAMVAAAAAAHAAMQGFDGPSSSESGKSHYMSDALDSHALHVSSDGTSSTNYLTPENHRAAAVLTLNSNHRANTSSEISPGGDASAAAAAMAAIAAEANALERSVLPSTIINSGAPSIHKKSEPGMAGGAVKTDPVGHANIDNESRTERVEPRDTENTDSSLHAAHRLGQNLHVEQLLVDGTKKEGSPQNEEDELIDIDNEAQAEDVVPEGAQSPGPEGSDPNLKAESFADCSGTQDLNSTCSPEIARENNDEPIPNEEVVKELDALRHDSYSEPVAKRARTDDGEARADTAASTPTEPSEPTGTATRAKSSASPAATSVRG